MGQIEITLHKEKKAKIDQGMFGLFFEDINYAADGGLYAQLIENRNFEALKAFGHKGDFYTVHDGLYAWSKIGDATLSIVGGSPVSEANPHYLRVVTGKPESGVSNKAYDGICLTKDMEYKISFYCRNVSGLENLVIRVGKDGKEAAALSIKLRVSEEESLIPWVLYEGTMKAKEDVRGGLFEMVLPNAGIVELDQVSCIPGDAVAGIFRKDLFDKLAEMKPGFIRFPGGCIVEGATLSNRYRFKDTLKPHKDRKNNWNRWAVHGNDNVLEDGTKIEESIYAHYNQSYGIGFYEFFLLCELLGAKAIPVLNVGLACQYQSYELAEPEDAEFAQYIEDALDLIAFANEEASGTWGSVRAMLGHPEPFRLTMVGIGNEQWNTKETRFFERYEKFQQAICEVYPEIRLIGSAGPDVNTERFEEAWKFIRDGKKKREQFVYAVDEHYYVKPSWLYEHVDFYDAYSRDVLVFAGEYAAHPEGSGTFNNYKANTLEGALSEAAFLTGIERNADVVALASYAPLFARHGYTQWSPDMIWFDDQSSYGTPSYYVQKAYCTMTGSVTLDTANQEKALWEKKIYYNPSLDEENNIIYFKIVNANEEEIQLNLTDAQGKQIHPSMANCLTGEELNGYNSLDFPRKYEWKECPEILKEGIRLPANSFTVLSIPL